MKTHSFKIALASSYFDFDDYDNSVHHYLQDLKIQLNIKT